jgi:hypothetical protein
VLSMVPPAKTSSQKRSLFYLHSILAKCPRQVKTVKETSEFTKSVPEPTGCATRLLLGAPRLLNLSTRA